MAFGKPVWLVSVLIAARAVGLLAGRLQLRRTGLRVPPGRHVLQMRGGGGRDRRGRGRRGGGRTELILLALALLLAVELERAVGRPRSR